MKTWLVVAGLGMGLLHGSSPADAQKPARTFAAKSRTLTAKAARKPAVLTPLTPREKVQQLLNRFTFGPRPGDVDQVMLMGADTWLAQQLDPDAIKDSATNRRLAAFPTLSMTVPQLMSVFPDRAQIRAVRDGKMAYPSDPLEHAMFEGQIYKMQHYNDELKTPEGKLVPRYLLTDEQKAAIRQQDQATASRLAGELLGLPKNQRMAALIQMPLQDRIVLTGNLNNDQRQLLFADMTPAERDTMLAMQANNTSAQHVGEELEQARILRDILTERQLQEVMTDFWFNHFNVYLQKRYRRVRHDGLRARGDPQERLGVLPRSAHGNGEVAGNAGLSRQLPFHRTGLAGERGGSAQTGVEKRRPRIERELWARADGAAYPQREWRIHAAGRDHALGDPDGMGRGSTGLGRGLPVRSETP